MSKEQIYVMFYADTYHATSGYSKVGKALAKRLAKMPEFNVYFQQLAGIEPIDIKDGVKILPVFNERTHPLFINNIVNNLRIIVPDIFIPISDIFLMRKDGLNKLNFSDMVFMPYVLLDAIHTPDFSELILDKANKILTAHEFGQAQLKEEGYSSQVLYHGVDEEYKPVSQAEKINLREKLNIPVDNKVFFFCGRNFMRKRPFRLLEAIAKYNQRVKENKTTFILHISDHTADGWNLELFSKRLEKRYQTKMDNIIFSKEHRLGEGLKEDEFVKYYQISDFYISASSGEGFGLPIIEAMACGIPVIAPDNTTHSYMLADGRGILVENESFMYVGHGTKHKLVNVDKLSEAIEIAVNLEDIKYKEYSDNSLKWVKEHCNWDKIANQLAEIIKTEVSKNGKK